MSGTTTTTTDKATDKADDKKVEKTEKAKGKPEKTKSEKKPAKKAKDRKNPVIAEMVGVGQRIRQARESKQMTQDDLAGKIGTTTQDVGQVENGWRSMSVVRVHVFARSLGVTPEWVFSGINPKVHAALVTNAKKFVAALDKLGEGDAPVIPTA